MPSPWARALLKEPRVCRGGVPAYDATRQTSRCMRCDGPAFHADPRPYDFPVSPFVQRARAAELPAKALA